MATLVSYKDADGQTHWTAEGSRAHRDHLASLPVEPAKPAAKPVEAKADVKPAVKDAKPA